MTDSLQVTDGHVAPAGLDSDTLVMMLDALGEFVGHALPPSCNSSSTTTTSVPRTSCVP